MAAAQAGAKLWLRCSSACHHRALVRAGVGLFALGLQGWLCCAQLAGGACRLGTPLDKDMRRETTSPLSKLAYILLGHVDAIKVSLRRAWLPCCQALGLKPNCNWIDLYYAWLLLHLLASSL